MTTGVEHTLRAPNDAERATIAQRRARWHAQAKTTSPHELLVPVVVSIAAVIVGVAIENVPVIVIRLRR
jgi:hypothetical protein